MLIRTIELGTVTDLVTHYDSHALGPESIQYNMIHYHLMALDFSCNTNFTLSMEEILDFTGKMSFMLFSSSFVRSEAAVRDVMII